MLLNMRSRETNFHGAINALIFWDQEVSKWLIEAFNHIGLSSSYKFQVHSVNALSKDVVCVARIAANNPNNLVELPYDNFNYISQFDKHIRTHLKLSAEQSFNNIIPAQHDYAAFCTHTIHYVAILAIQPHQTYRYHLPTFDQEQASTYENMVVLEHYFLEVLQIVDISPFCFDHFSCFEMLDSLMHYYLNMGSGDNTDKVNTCKYSFYTWLQFLNMSSRFEQLCAAIIDGIKQLESILLLHNLMTLHEMHGAIKIFWALMYYAGGSYNYAHEIMELLHNSVHDWPSNTAEVLFTSMLVNTTKGNLDVEHLNNAIKACAHDSNASPKLLEKITPAIDEVRQLIYVEDIYQWHSHVKQDKDTLLLVEHMQKNQIFRWSHDRSSVHTFSDLLHHSL
ncbi:hypothetical protein BDY19DRAFT_987286 [Irpex rosettiformis]|uniref:Uncharacterized protein n=1 Tax=Irpex rosettiformis TaxID=378272 RepID=A0ACB8TSK6_9APHY|nr:hypothetical protein BDY19DRAFT_987286 [Irpex rosettiformis]